MRYVALDDLRVIEPKRIALPDSAQVLATSQAGPVIALVLEGDTRHVVVGFDLIKSNWPMQISFPVFTSNSLQWLGLNGHTETGIGFRPGQTVSVPVNAGVGSLVYDGPVTLRVDQVKMELIGEYTG